ncbi:hypothetical protein BDZ45DRAFT_398223 [Acephala macrosclerotiorum]|nr:hypothetical protein BDZ45DRAFT_398223 [Acephala macrosclerotiorum]
MIQGLHALMREVESDRGQLRQSMERKDQVIQSFESRLRVEAEAKSKLKSELKKEIEEYEKEIEGLERGFEKRLQTESKATLDNLKRLEKESDDHAKEIKRIKASYETDLKAASNEKEELKAQHLKEVKNLQITIVSSCCENLRLTRELQSLKEAMEAEGVKHKNMESELNTSKTEIETANRAAQKSDQMRAELVREHQHAREQWEIQLQKSKDEMRKQSETLDAVLKENDILRNAERRLEIRRQALAKRYGAECRQLEAKIAKTEQSILGGRFAQAGSVLLIPLHPPTSVGKSRRPQIFEAWIAPDMPEGWISYWEDSQNTWVFVNEQTSESQFQRPTTPPPKPPKLPENPDVLPQDSNTDSINEISRTSKNTAPITPPLTPPIAESDKGVFELPTTSQTNPLLTKGLTFRGKKKLISPKSKQKSKEGEAVTAMLEKTANRPPKQRAMFGIFRSTVPTSSAEIQIQNTVPVASSVLAYSAGWIVLCCVLIYLLVMVFTEQSEEIVATDFDHSGYIDFETWLFWFNDQCPVAVSLGLPAELAFPTCAAVMDQILYL